MATRQAAIRLSLKSGAFQSEMRRLTGQVAASGRKMGTALRAPLSAGLGAAKRSLAGFGDQLKNQIKLAGTLGGSIATGMLLKDAMQLQGLYRNVAFDISKVHGEAVTWQDIQADVDRAVASTSQGATGLAKAFHSVFQATGDLEYSRSAMNAIGAAATASGKDIEHFAIAGQMMMRKFNISAEEMPDAMAKFMQMTGTGAKSIEELGPRFGMLAGEAKMAGLTGAEGMQKLLGIFKLIDSEIGEKADPALTQIFQTLKEGSTYAERFSKVGVKFTPDMSALERLRELLKTMKGRSEAQVVFTGAARTAYDILVRPFDEAMKEAQDKGMARAEATDYALAKFDDSFETASAATWNYAELQKRASKRMQEDPTAKLRVALNTLREAFAKPKMIKAITTLAEKLPILAEKLADLIAWVAENPWKAAGIVGAAKIGVPVASAAAGTAVAGAAPGVLKKIAKLGAKAAPAAAGAAAPAVAGVAGTVGAAGALAVTGTVAAGAAVGGAVGYGIYKAALEPAIEERLKALRGVDEMLLTADETLRSDLSPENLKAVIGMLKAAKDEADPGVIQSMLSGVAKFWGADIKSAEQQHAERVLKLSEAEFKLQQKVELLERSMGLAADGAKRFNEVVMAPGGATRGPAKPANDKPGAEHVPG